MRAKAATDIQQKIDLLREKSLDKLTIYLFVCVFFLAAIYVLRIRDIDWQDIYFLDVICIALGLIVISLRKRISYRGMVYCYLVLGIVVATVEFMGVGIGGMGDMVSLFCIMLSLFYLDRKATYLVGFTVTAIYGFAFYEFVYAGKTLSENDITYMSWYSSWIGTYVAGVVLFVLIGMSVFHLQTQTFGLLAEVEYQKSIIDEQKQRLEHFANHDALTGLPSARAADSLLEKAINLASKKHHKTAVLFLDLDGFKKINDTYGHAVGDEVLKNVSKRIISVIRTSDKACRIGGDEFLLIIEKVDDLKDLEGLCQRLITAISSPYNYKNYELSVGVSIGAASYPDIATTAQNLRIKADELMYQVKKSGKNNYRIVMGVAGCVPPKNLSIAT